MAKRGQAVRRSPTRSKVPTKPKRAPADVDLKRENAALRLELAEALERQTAASEVLQVLSSTPGDLEPVFQSLLENATRVCGAKFGSMLLLEGDIVRQVALYNVPPAYADAFGTRTFRPHPKGGAGQVIRTKQVAHIADLRTNPAYLEGDPTIVALSDLAGARTFVVVPMLRDAKLVGMISVYREEVRPFADKQIELLSNFAKQAVIAIENTRLLGELRESLQQQTATADVLKVISRSTFDLQTVLDTLVESAARLCEAEMALIHRREGEQYRAAATFGFSPEFWAFMQAHPISPGRGSIAGRVALERHAIQIEDVAVDPEYTLSQATSLARQHTALGVPLLRENELIGVIVLARQRVELFTEKQIELVSTFADQAVIAIENARLFDEVQAKTRDLEESLQQQTATSEVLQIISSSPGDLAPVFDKMLENATRVCGAEFGSMYLVEDDSLRQAALYNVPAALAAARTNKVFRPHPQGQMAAAIRTKQAVQVADVRATAAYLERTPNAVELAELGGARTLVVVPMLREEEVIGAITIYRQEVRPFTDKQIELVNNFAKQSVIAIDNTRLLNELRQSLEQQTATSEVLKVISTSPGELEPIFQAMLENAVRICGARFGNLFLCEGDGFRVGATHGAPPAYVDYMRREPVFFQNPKVGLGLILKTKKLYHLADIAAAPTLGDKLREATINLAGARTLMGVPMLKGDKVIGAIVIYRQEVLPFSDKQIELVQNFAAQSVIAIENARLLKELRESLQQQTATADVLKVISRSTFDLQTVLDTLVDTAARLCHADQARMYRRQGDHYHSIASHGFPPENEEWLSRNPIPTAGRGTVIARAAAERCTVHIADVLADPEYTWHEGQRVAGYRTVLAVPLLRGETLIGLFSLLRTRVAPFTDKEIELVATFADQAAIAIENARLLGELNDRQAELRVTFDNMGDGVVMFDAAARLTAWNRNFQEMLDLPDAFLAGRPNYAEYFRYLAERGEYSTDLEAELSRTIEDTSREMRLERARPDGRVIEVRRNPVAGGGFVLIYSDITERKRAEEAIRTARDAAEATLRDLQTAQASLVQAQKMAALGQLTAGIAHEIKNPLNFVNNFSALSAELIDELDDVLKPAALDSKTREETSELTHMLKGNLEKVVQHGKRADSIVKNMLLHYREGSGERRPVNLNALVDESLNLAYHGARAENAEFKIRLERSFDPATGEVDLFPQEMTRALLNMISNGFYAATKRKAKIGFDEHEPTLSVATKNLGNSVEITIRDNGSGIPPEVKERIFNPFFTTKPPGEGTGLGLSLSYDIVVKQHAGLIEVDTQPDEFTEFKVILPRTDALSKAGAAT
jgi:PAS domain S-box-containing protein